MNNLPMEINISIANAQDALAYWLTNVVFRDKVVITNVTFDEEKHFTIKLDRNLEEK